MFCSNCGSKNNENSSYCTACGEKLTPPVMQAQQQTYAPPVTQQMHQQTYTQPTFQSKTQTPANYVKQSTNNVLMNFLGYVSILILFAIGISYLVCGISSYSDNEFAFYLLEDNTRLVGQIIYWIMASVILFDTLTLFLRCLLKGVSGRHIYGIALSCFLVSGIMTVAGLVCSEPNLSNDFTLLCYRLFGTYKDVSTISLFISLIPFILGLVCNNLEK